MKSSSRPKIIRKDIKICEAGQNIERLPVSPKSPMPIPELDRTAAADVAVVSRSSPSSERSMQLPINTTIYTMEGQNLQQQDTQK